MKDDTLGIIFTIGAILGTTAIMAGTMYYIAKEGMKETGAKSVAEWYLFGKYDE